MKATILLVAVVMLEGCSKEDPTQPEPNRYSVPNSPMNVIVFAPNDSIFRAEWVDASDNEDGFSAHWDLLYYSTNRYGEVKGLDSGFIDGRAGDLPENSTFSWGQHHDWNGSVPSVNWGLPFDSIVVKFRVYSRNRGGTSPTVYVNKTFDHP